MQSLGCSNVLISHVVHGEHVEHLCQLSVSREPKPSIHLHGAGEERDGLADGLAQRLAEVASSHILRHHIAHFPGPGLCALLEHPCHGSTVLSNGNHGQSTAVSNGEGQSAIGLGLDHAGEVLHVASRASGASLQVVPHVLLDLCLALEVVNVLVLAVAELLCVAQPRVHHKLQPVLLAQVHPAVSLSLLNLLRLLARHKALHAGHRAVGEEQLPPVGHAERVRGAR